MKSENWIIVELGAAILVFGLLSFFFVPVYEKGGWEAMSIFSTAFGTVLGYKFGRSMPQQTTDAKPGQSAETKTESKVVTVPDPLVDPLPPEPTNP